MLVECVSVSVGSVYVSGGKDVCIICVWGWGEGVFVRVCVDVCLCECVWECECVCVVRSVCLWGVCVYV